MHWSQNLNAWSEKGIVSNPYAADIENDAIEVEKYSLAKLDVPAIVTVKRRLHPYGISALAKKLPKQIPAEILFGLSRSI